MAIGDITEYTAGEVKAVEILASTTATNGAPSGASAGIAITEISNLFNFMPNEVGLIAYSTAGSGDMEVTLRQWTYHEGVNDWFPIGILNGGSPIGEAATDKIRHEETLSMIGVLGTRLYTEVVSISGTSTAVAVKAVVRRGYPR